MFDSVSDERGNHLGELWSILHFLMSGYLGGWDEFTRLFRTPIAADTVIHYDPWWNPAVEARATDRAHRLGQKSTVFVHKLICEGTIEEKILALRERKAALVAGLLSASRAVARFSEDDLEALLAPLGERCGWRMIG